MKVYWDSSALIEAWSDHRLRSRLRSEGGFTRTHSLCEVSPLSPGGNLGIRMDADDAAKTVKNLAADLQFVDLASTEVVAALVHARRHRVRGGSVHDFMHALASENCGADELLTVDENDFESLVQTVKIRHV